jgi:DNA replication protein DnaC
VVYISDLDLAGVPLDVAVAVAAKVERLVHHAEVIALEGESYRLKDREREVVGARKRR